MATLTPPAPPTNVRFTRISAGYDHSLAIGSDGNTYAWGYNNEGELGDGTNTQRSLPVRVNTPTGVTFTQINAGKYHSLAIGSDGNTYAWGDNGSGELGDDSKINRSTPVPVHAPSGVTFTQISAGGAHSLAIGSDGNTYAWGDNSFGQMGTGTSSSTLPKRVSAPAGVTFTQINAGWNHSLAIGSNRNTYAWGANWYYQLGDDSKINRSTPVPVHAPSGVTFTQISAGWGHSMAIGSDNYTYAWGYNNEGELGDGTPNLRSTPVRVSTPAGVRFTRISAGYWHSLAIGSDGNTYTYGSAYAWGNNSEGELGHGTGGNQHTPAPVSTPSSGNPTNTWKTISAGNSHSLALDSDGHAYAWGYNRFGQLGDGTTNDHSKPAPVLTPRYVIDGVAFGGASVTSKTVNATTGAWDMHVPQHTPGAVDVTVAYHLDGLDVNGNIANPRYQSGTVTLRYTYATPYTVSFQLGGAPGTPPASQYSYPDDPQPINWPVPDPVWAGHWFDGWAKPDGSPWDFTQPVRNDLTLTATWRTPRFTMTPTRGPDTGGAAIHVTPPNPPDDGITYMQVSAGYTHSLAIGTDGNAYSWGDNQHGQLGDGTTANRNLPVRVHAPNGARFTSVSAGNGFSLAISSDGRLYSWGSNSNGQLGDGAATDRATPVPVNPAADGTATWKTISAGYYHSLALSSDGHAYSWGSNANGQLGNGGTDANPHTTPSRVTDPSGTTTWTSVSAGGYHSLAISGDGHAYSWGANQYGQLGSGTNPHTTPAPVSDPAGKPNTTWTSVSAGQYHSLAISGDGHAYSWGSNNNGRLGDNTTTDRTTPTPVSDPTGKPNTTWTSVSAGGAHSLAISGDHHAYSWGWNTYGQLGNGSSDSNPHTTPAPVSDPAGKPNTTWTSVSAGGAHSLAISGDHHAYSWGWNAYGQLGDGATTNRGTLAPVHAPAITVTGVTLDQTNAPDPTWNTTNNTWDITTPPHPEGQATATIHWTLGGSPQTDYPLTYEYYDIRTLPKAGGTPAHQLAGATLLALTTLAALTFTGHQLATKHHHTNQPTTTTTSSK
ncbi:RCC1 domain-containing protein [Bifidobacterium actinocoloniiforme]|uniref:RCC1 domain-containing protein n=4 Tax=Bifidobacterium actinocoloniiforme TaxID=638619 RepID=UPI00130E4C0D|nr:RCC1 domain-containing protein [Bifidobacterium actinocoloniiforme]